MKKPEQLHYRVGADDSDLQKLQDTFTQGIKEVRKNIAFALVPPAATALLFFAMSIKKVIEGNDDYLIGALLSLPVLILALYATDEARAYLQVLLQQRELLSTDPQEKFDKSFIAKIRTIKHIESTQDVMKCFLFLALISLTFTEGANKTTLLNFIAYILQAITLIEFERLAAITGAMEEKFRQHIVTQKQIRIVLEAEPQLARDEVQPHELGAQKMKR